jgi:phage terminase large subunit-like protein
MTTKTPTKAPMKRASVRKTAKTGRKTGAAPSSRPRRSSAQGEAVLAQGGSPSEPRATRDMGRYERLAYERHQRDLELCAQPGGHPKGFYFDEIAAERAVIFVERFCRHHKGEWAGKHLLLESWQKFIFRCAFGWKRADGTRRFRVVYTEVPRKNGKSETAGGVGNYLLVGDGEPGAEIYSTATKEDQAKLVWTSAKEMVAQSPDLKKWVRAFQKSLYCARTKSFFRPLGSDSDTLDGLNPHGHICDELHAHKKRGLYDVMITGMGARRQPLTWIITTAGVYDPESIGWEQHYHAMQVLDGTVEDDEFFCIIFAADEGDDWKDEATWRKANPNYGVSVKPDYLAAQARRAEQTPSFLNSFLRLHLNLWTQQVTRWIDLDKWNACGSPLPPIDNWRGREAHLAADLSTKRDITALAIDIPDGGVHHFYWKFYVPAGLVLARAQERKTPDYAAWVREGWLTETPGDVVDYDFILRDVLALRQLLRVRQFAYDPWNASQFANDLEAEGFSREPDAKKEQLIEVRQGFKSMSEPSKEFEKLIIERKLRHGSNPIARWMIDNTAIRHDANENIAPDKRAAVGKIDGIVAGIMALGRAILVPTTRMSVYETRGVRVF